MPVNQLKQFLDEHQVKYVSIVHSPAYTAQEVAASAHVSGKQMAKTVMVKMGEQLAMVVLPAHDHIDFARLKEVLAKPQVDLASESEFKGHFPGCEVGAMPPFGNLYNVPVIVSSKLSQSDHIVFNAGTHAELMQVSYADFARLVQPKIVSF